MIPTLLIAAATLGAGETVTVTTIDDGMDFTGGQTVADLPGPDGIVTFREALAAANNTPGPQTIHFAIPRSDWEPNDVRATLRLEDGSFSLLDDGTTVDFTTQTDFTGDTNPAGWEVGVYGYQPNGWGGPAVYVGGNDCTIIGLDRVLQRGYGVHITGDDNRVLGCTISGPLYAGVKIAGFFNGDPPTGNVVGGTAPGEGNRLSGGNSGVRIDGPAENNIVIGNVLTGAYAGVEVRTPTCCPGNVARGNRIGGPTPGERNVIADAGHYGEEGFPVGAQVTIEYSPDTIVEGNWIGLTPDGSASAVQVGPVGVRVLNADGAIVRNNAIGGIAVNGFNHADGLRFGVGIAVTGDCAGTVIEDNRVGTDATGTTAVPNHAGISVGLWPGEPGPADTTIAGNTVAFNETSGIAVASTVSGVTISANSIFENGEAGLLIPSGPAAPALDTAEIAGTMLTVTGAATAAPGAALTIELFASPACDPSGAGEGQVFLGAVPATADAGGTATFTAVIESNAAAGDAITATATTLSSGSTSAFSACLEATPGAEMPGDATGDGLVDVDDLVMVITAWGVCPDPGNCPADLDDDGDVDVDDLVLCMTNWS